MTLYSILQDNIQYYICNLYTCMYTHYIATATTLLSSTQWRGKSQPVGDIIGKQKLWRKCGRLNKKNMMKPAAITNHSSRSSGFIGFLVPLPISPPMTWSPGHTDLTQPGPYSLSRDKAPEPCHFKPPPLPFHLLTSSAHTSTPGKTLGSCHVEHRHSVAKGHPPAGYTDFCWHQSTSP